MSATEKGGRAAAPELLLPPVHCVVTGRDENARSIIVSDGPSPNVGAPPSGPEWVARVIWASEVPVRNDVSDITADPHWQPPMHAENGGTIFRIADIPPDAVYDPATASQTFREIRGEHAQAGGNSDRPFWFHKTDPLDYAIVREGGIWALLDEGETVLYPGDVLIQRGTSHAWLNGSNKPARVAFVLIGAGPYGE